MSNKSTNICKQKEGKMDFLKIAKHTQDMQLNSTWSGSVYALKDVLSYVDNNKDIAISSKVIIKNYLEEQIKKYQDLKDNTDIGKTLKGIEKKVGVEITQRGRKMLNKQDYIKLQMESADNDFVNALLYEHYNNEVKNMSDQEFKNHLKNMGIDNESQAT